jgi:hypothetical protein
MSLYEIAILGRPTETERAGLVSTLRREVEQFGLQVGREVALLDVQTLGNRDPRAALAACFFVTEDKHTALEVASGQSVISAGAPIIPTIPHNGSFAATPAPFAAANGLRRRLDDPVQVELATALLECVGLLRAQRRVFVSYRRCESKTAAVQLHDILSGRGFDAFLDTHDIRPGRAFQEVLWHRLCDSDVMIMLDTPGYFESRWTRQEIGRARAKDIQVLRIVWPGHTPSRFTDLADTLYLNEVDLQGADGPIRAALVDGIMLKVEVLRSRSLAARHRLIAGKLAAEAERVGGLVEAIGAHRAIALRLMNGALFWAYPVVGVPTADLLQDIAEKAARAGQTGTPALVYDHVGLMPRWIAHLAWLEEKIADVRWIKVTEAAWALAGLDDVNG